MKSSEISELINRVNNTNKNIKLVLTDEEYQICIEHGVSSNKILKISEGNVGHCLSSAHNIGKYICRKGYYKIIDIIPNYQVGDGRVFQNALITYFNLNNSTHFIKEEIVINPTPLYNYQSIGPKIKLEKGMILCVIEDTIVVDGSYKIVWKVVQ